ncbi:hypothetical protein KAR91_55930 [Candidatus Pacearchaeota archaeon]|nr:hypothetical protein [Candidatus Pacearchaeota archaeon]
MHHRIKLKSLNSEEGAVDVVYDVSSNNEKTTVTQELLLTKKNGAWRACMPMDDFPDCKTISEAVEKLSNWMERLSSAIKDQKFDTVDLDKL